jgi:BirA family biotin operon repressor/biotin-[acetyl-CoA-carboxylase] ligase
MESVTDLLPHEKRQAALSHLRQHAWISEADWFSEIDSTNEELRRRVAHPLGCVKPALVVADSQTMGRGRGGNRWWSPTGCLMFSILWDPVARPGGQGPEAARQGELALVVGLAVAQSIQEFIRPACRVKWPNDVYVGEQKIAGTLIESAGREGWIIGVGINVRTPLEAAPAELQPRITSLHIHASAHPGVEDVLVEFLDVLPGYLERWSHEDDFLAKEWPSRCLLQDRWVRVESVGKIVEGRCVGINRAAELGVVDRFERTHWIRSGVVHHFATDA